MMHPVALIACPRCGAEKGYACFTRTGRTMRNSYHVERTSKHILIEAQARKKKAAKEPK
jgi:hypothetical protein